MNEKSNFYDLDEKNSKTFKGW